VVGPVRGATFNGRAGGTIPRRRVGSIGRTSWRWAVAPGAPFYGPRRIHHETTFTPAWGDLDFSPIPAVFGRARILWKPHLPR